MHRDRFYMNGKIKINWSTVVILKNMNRNVLQRSDSYDYQYICRLLGALFNKATLRSCSAGSSNMRKTAYARLDFDKFKFIEGKTF